MAKRAKIELRIGGREPNEGEVAFRTNEKHGRVIGETRGDIVLAGYQAKNVPVHVDLRSLQHDQKFDALYARLEAKMRARVDERTHVVLGFYGGEAKAKKRKALTGVVVTAAFLRRPAAQAAQGATALLLLPEELKITVTRC